ncbi:DUF3630 family protein [Gallaecimonas kandeliae]|uniref:DUF3630 family protein n=1 Tax=Gallaecimonas kandeliae TaxID=3029055 RepID=UPI00264A0FA4|nr:DUF3630 family protein [Gallaecimonas kandeliae]WKE65440.1 DUF3630 family protein [Gallaecimonas kandeliae]
MRLDKEHKTLLLPLTSSWDSFEADIQPWLERLELRVLRKENGADRHQWWLDFEGTELRLEFEEMSGSAWLEAEDEEGLEVLAFLARFHGGR